MSGAQMVSIDEDKKNPEVLKSHANVLLDA
jgi:hypothetical protein